MKRLLSVLLLGLLAIPVAHAATPSTIPRTRPAPLRPAPDGQRFLFVVENSAAMRAIEAGNRQALFDLIFTGLDGQMRTGDSFGLWLFNDELRAREFPLQIWEEQKPIDTASLAAKFLREQKYSGKARPEVFMPKLLTLMKTVRDVNVLIFSDGVPLQGTPFDAKMAGAYARRRDEQTRAQKPFVTTLIARGGAIVTGSVVIAGEYIELPQRPPPSVAATSTNSVPTNTTAPRVVTAPPPAREVNAPPATPPRAPAPETAEPKSTGSFAVLPRPKVVQFITRSNVVQSAEPVATNVQVASAPPSPAAPTNSPTVTPAPEPPPVTPPAHPVTPAPEPVQAAVAAAPPFLTSAPLPVAAREVRPPVPADARPVASGVPEASLVVVPPVASDNRLLLVIGGVLLLGCLGLLALALRRPKPSSQTSFITRSMDRRTGS